LFVNFIEHVGFAAEAESYQTIPFFMRAKTEDAAFAAFGEIFTQESRHRQPTFVVYRRYCRA
jgi:hypothetical protein